MNLDSAREFFEAKIAPVANALDRDEDAMRTALESIADAGLFALRRPAAYGGPEWPEADFRSFQELIAEYSGALAFLQTQHQSAISMLSKSENESLKQACLGHAHTVSGGIGIGFSQLRRPGPPAVTATPVSGGYLLNGVVPWVTGEGFFPKFLIGAQLESGEAVFGIVPLESQPGIVLSAPMELCAMQAARTVSVELHDWFLDESLVAFIQPNGWIARNDTVNVTLQGSFAIGCCRAALKIVEEAAAKRNVPPICDALTALRSELHDCAEALGRRDEPYELRLKSRAWIIDLAVRCAHAAVVVSSGAANKASHPAQRIYREALVFSVSAQTTDIMIESLNRLVERRK